MIFHAAALPISAAPNSDEQKCRNQRELVKGVKEEEIDRRESANGAARDEKKAGVKGIFDAARFPPVNQIAPNVTIAVSSSMMRLRPSMPKAETQPPRFADRK